MRHRVGFKQLSRSSSQRKSLLRSQLTSLFTHERIVTTAAKAKASRSLAEKVITKARNCILEVERLNKEGSPESILKAKGLNVHCHRILSRYVYTEAVLAKLFSEIAPLFKERNGGYTRILKLYNRNNDAAEMVVLELVEHTQSNIEGADKKDKKSEKKKTSSKVKMEKSASQVSEAKAKKVKGVSESRVTRQKKGGN